MNATGNWTYVPSDYVKYGHLLSGYSYLLVQKAAPYLDQLPRSVTWSLNPEVNGAVTAFETHYGNSTSTRAAPSSTITYGLSISLLPLAWFLMALLSLCCYNQMLCFRGCCGWFKCVVKPGRITKSTTSALAKAATKAIEKAAMQGRVNEKALRMRDKAEADRVHTSIVAQRKRLTGLFVLFVLIQLAAGVGLAYISNSFFEQAYSEFDSSLAGLLEVHKHWTDSGAKIRAYGTAMQNNLQYAVRDSECDATSRMDAISAKLADFNEPLPSLTTALDFLGSPLKSADEEYLPVYLGEYREYGLYTVAGIAFLSGVSFLLMAWVGPERKHSAWRRAVCCGQCVVFLFAILAVPLLLLTFVIADICIMDSPFKFLGSQVPAGISTNVTDIFLACNNPFQPIMSQALAGIHGIISPIEALLDAPAVSGSTCPDSRWIQGLNWTAVQESIEIQGFVGMKPSKTCPTLNPYAEDMVEKNICGDTYNAIFALTAAVAATGFITYILLIIMPRLLSHWDYMLKIWDSEVIQGDDTDSEDELDPDDLVEKPKPPVVLFEENKDEDDNDSAVSKVTEFDWTKLGDDGEGKGPYDNPNGKPAKRNVDNSQLFDVEEEEGGKPKTVEDVVHFEAINEAGHEDDL